MAIQWKALTNKSAKIKNIKQANSMPIMPRPGKKARKIFNEVIGNQSNSEKKSKTKKKKDSVKAEYDELDR